MGLVCWKIVFTVVWKKSLNRRYIREGNHFVFLEKKIHERFKAMDTIVIGRKNKISGENCLKMPFSFSVIFLFGFVLWMGRVLLFC